MGDDHPPDRVVVAVPAADTPFCSTGLELEADRLFRLGASAVSEVDGVHGEPRLVADLPVSALEDLLTGRTDVELLEVDPALAGMWQQHASAVRVGERLIVRPEWVQPDPRIEDRIEIVVDAADAFGSGSHPSTQLCLAVTESLVQRDDRVLDVGCGSGVLGVAALRLGAGSLVGIDVEPTAVAATGRTAELNGVAHRLVEVSARTVEEVTDEHGPFDLVLANLLVPVVEEIGADLAQSVAPDGHLVLGGLLADPATRQVERALAAVRPLADAVEVLESDNWAVLTIHRGL